MTKPLRVRLPVIAVFVLISLGCGSLVMLHLLPEIRARKIEAAGGVAIRSPFEVWYKQVFRPRVITEVAFDNLPTAECLATVARCWSVQSLDVRCAGGAAHPLCLELPGLPRNLSRLSLSTVRLDRADLCIIEARTSLEFLSMVDVVFDDGKSLDYSRLTSLVMLSVNRANLRADSLRQLLVLPKLREIFLNDCDLDAGAYAVVADLRARGVWVDIGNHHGGLGSSRKRRLKPALSRE